MPKRRQLQRRQHLRHNSPPPIQLRGAANERQYAGGSKDKVILVTGAGRGIGRDISILAASQGAKVVVNDIGGTEKGEGADRAPAMEVVAEIKDAGGDAVANYDSVSGFDAAHNMVEQAKNTFGQLDGVVNNAGILRDVIFHKMTEEDFDLVIGVHLKGSFNVSRAAATGVRPPLDILHDT